MITLLLKLVQALDQWLSWVPPAPTLCPGCELRLEHCTCPPGRSILGV